MVRNPEQNSFVPNDLNLQLFDQLLQQMIVMAWYGLLVYVNYPKYGHIYDVKDSHLEKLLKVAQTI